ncbi:hypothetical protein OAN96_00640 [Candidatus Gracilibacteria bacterium]|nr:hypothetical protein [Candidatus Gracilibacteria bacterium]
MSKKITVEIDAKYRAPLDILKTAFSTPEGKPIEKDNEVVEGLIESFLSFLQQQQSEQHVHGPDCNHD